MSWDFYVEIDVGGPKPLTVCDELNYTSNIAPMFYAAMGDDGIRQLDGLTGEECKPILRAVLVAMEDNPAKYREMNPKNGWGDYEGALGVLRTLIEWCCRAPKATMRIY